MEYTKITLLEMQGMIATNAIENQEHAKAYKRISYLVRRFGGLLVIDYDILFKYCYGEKICARADDGQQKGEQNEV